MFKLRLIQNGVPEEVVAIEGNEAVIGRSPDCDLVIPQPYVSKRHVKILRGLVVVDLDSRNGTFVGSRRLKEATVLADARISLGDEDAVVEIDLVGDEEDTLPATSVGRRVGGSGGAGGSGGSGGSVDAGDAEHLQKQLDIARAEVHELRRLTAFDDEPLADTAKIDRDKIELQSRVRSQELEIERLRRELEQRKQ